jgi:prepilin-type N-terminal cleavage/methylation domain-containing protein
LLKQLHLEETISPNNDATMREGISMKARTNHQSGFTLLELISVVVILGILAAVVTPKYLDISTESVDNAAIGLLSELTSRAKMETAEYYVANIGSTPSCTDPNLALTEETNEPYGKLQATVDCDESTDTVVIQVFHQGTEKANTSFSLGS